MFIKVLIQFFLLDEIGQTQIKLVRITKENNELQDEILILKQGTWYTPEQTAGEHQEERFKTYKEINRKVQKKEEKKIMDDRVKNTSETYGTIEVGKKRRTRY